MSKPQLFAVETNGPTALPVSPDATGFDAIYTGLALGVYSSLRTFQHNKFLYLEQHLARTVQSMRLSGWTYEWDETLLRRSIDQVCCAYPSDEMRVRIDVLAEPAASLGTSSRVLIGLMPFTPTPAEYYEEGVRVAFAEGLARENPLIKAAGFTEERKAFSTGTPDAYERLLVEPDGTILEGASSNFYGVRDGVVYTANEGILEGITRRILLQNMADLGIPVSFTPVRVDQLDQLDEAAISSSSRALMPVVAIEGAPIGSGKPGPLCNRILTAYRAFVASEVKSAVEGL